MAGVPARGPCTLHRRAPGRSGGRVQARALPFGFGRKKEIIDDEKRAMWESQQEIIRARRSGKQLDGVSERRAKAKAAAAEKAAKRKRDRDSLKRGEAIADDEPSKPYGDKDEGMQGGIIIPLAPFGIPKFDNGERFDLKALYTDEGWVDESADPLGWAKGLFGGKKKKSEDGGEEDKGEGSRPRRASKGRPAEARTVREEAPKKKRWPWS